MPIPREVHLLTGLRKAHLDGGPTCAHALTDLMQWLGSLRTRLSAQATTPLTLVAHNGWRFDFSILCAEAERWSLPATVYPAGMYVLDSLYYCNMLRAMEASLAAAPSLSLAALHARFCAADICTKQTQEAAHRAGADAMMLSQVLMHRCIDPRLHSKLFFGCMRTWAAVMEAHQERRVRFLERESEEEREKRRSAEVTERARIDRYHQQQGSKEARARATIARNTARARVDARKRTPEVFCTHVGDSYVFFRMLFSTFLFV